MFIITEINQITKTTQYLVPPLLEVLHTDVDAPDAEAVVVGVGVPDVAPVHHDAP